MKVWWFFPAAIVVSVGGVLLSDRSLKKRALRHMAAREPLTDAQFGQRFFAPESADIAARLRAILARHIPVDLSRVDPSDRVVEDLHMDDLDSMSTVEFVLDVEKEFGIDIPDSAAEKMRTLRDVVDYVFEAKKQAG